MDFEGDFLSDLSKTRGKRSGTVDLDVEREKNRLTADMAGWSARQKYGHFANRREGGGLWGKVAPDITKNRATSASLGAIEETQCQTLFFPAKGKNKSNRNRPLCTGGTLQSDDGHAVANPPYTGHEPICGAWVVRFARSAPPRKGE